MEKISLSELSKLKRDFDIFDSPHLPQSQAGAAPVFFTEEEVVWGFPRLRNIQSMGGEECWGVRAAERDPVSLLSLALSLENRRDRYSLKEKCKIYKLLEKRGAEERADEIAPLISTKGSYLVQVKQVLTLPGPLRNCVEEELIDTKTAHTVSDLPREAVQVYLKQMLKTAEDGKQGSMPLSHSRRRLLLIYLYEIVKREGRGGPKAVKTFSQILSETSMEKAFDKARRLRFPELTEREEALRRFEETYLRGTGLKMEAPPNFEGDSFRFSFSVNSSAQLDTMIHRLQAIREQSDELFRVL